MEEKGLKALRRNNDKTPKYKCDNCKCARYSPCGCIKSESKKKSE